MRGFLGPGVEVRGVRQSKAGARHAPGAASAKLTSGSRALHLDLGTSRLCLRSAGVGGMAAQLFCRRGVMFLPSLNCSLGGQKHSTTPAAAPAVQPGPLRPNRRRGLAPPAGRASLLGISPGQQGEPRQRPLADECPSDGHKMRSQGRMGDDDVRLDGASMTCVHHLCRLGHAPIFFLSPFPSFPSLHHRNDYPVLLC
ncbi:hypothetical protein NDU88_006577 [Pleurodeles waltl]|uniref:Uncharacterized protein n=1 Tax=Pleurodeles waltl TaxID=8319 RepID=A0AAV7NQL4_PLEWA|nr:hypothetical protein NDU88_006577 [Pleurodeles waltl]